MEVLATAAEWAGRLVLENRQKLPDEIAGVGG